MRRLVKAGVARALSEAGVDLAAAMPLVSGEPDDRRAPPSEIRPFPSVTADGRAAVASGDVPFDVGPPREQVRPGDPVTPLARSRTVEEQMSFTTEAALPLYSDAPWEVLRTS